MRLRGEQSAIERIRDGEFLTMPGGSSIGYGKGEAVLTTAERLSFARPGLTILAGVNGQGKTTLMKYLCGCLSEKPATGYSHAYLPEELAFSPFLTAGQVSRACLDTREALDFFREKGSQMSLPAELEFSKLSRGNKQKLKVLLTVALAREQDVDLLCLDEPFSGLDFLARRCLWAILESERRLRHILVSVHHSDSAISPNRILVISRRKLLELPSKVEWSAVEDYINPVAA